MKKITSLQYVTFITLTLGTPFIVQSYGNKQIVIPKEQAHQTCSDSMKKLKKELRAIENDLKKSKNYSIADERLRNLEKRIKAFIADLKKDEKHGKMWELHEHTLNRKVRDIRKYIKENN